MRKILGVLVAFFLIFTFTIQPKITEAKVSYSWNPKKEYLYSNNRIMIFTETNAKGIQGWGDWSYMNADDYSIIGYKESKNCLYQYPNFFKKNSSYIKLLSYPIKKGKKWSCGSNTCKYISIKETVKTKAGTFKNVVVVLEESKKVKQRKYYAPNVGLIMTKDYTNSSVKQLVKISK